MSKFDPEASEVYEEEDEDEEEDEEGSQTDEYSGSEEKEVDDDNVEEDADHVDENDNLHKNVMNNEKSPLVVGKASATGATVRPKMIREPSSRQKPAKNVEKDAKEKTESTVKSTYVEMATLKRMPTKVMVDKAITALNEKKGVSLVAIKKYILANFQNVDEKRFGLYVLKYLKKSVAEGRIEQNKQRFKLADDKKPKPKLKAAKTKAPNGEKVVPASSEKVAIKTTKLTKKPKEPTKATKTIEPSTSADVLKSKKPKAIKKTDAASTSTAVSDQDKQKPKTKRNLFNGTENGTAPAKVPKPTNTKAKAKESPAISEEPGPSKNNVKKNKPQKPKK